MKRLKPLMPQIPCCCRKSWAMCCYQVIYHAAMEEEQGSFSIDDVCDGVCKKLVTRHPHIFGDIKADTAEEVLSNWEEIKQREKGQKTATETLESVPKVFPALMRAERFKSELPVRGWITTA